MRKSIYLFLLAAFAVPLSTLQAQELSAMSFNIRYDNPKDGENAWPKRKNEVVKLLQYYHPDFLGTQEGLKHQLDFMKERLSEYQMIGVGREDGKEKGEYTAIFYDASKFELEKQETFWLSESQKVGSVGWDAALERICTYGIFKEKTTGKKLYVFNAHFDHRGEQARTESAKLIVKKITEVAGEDANVVLMGDFNSVPESAAIQSFAAALEDAYTKAQKEAYGPVGTFNGFDPNRKLDNRIDYVFTKNLNVHSCRHIDDRRKDNYFISDHLPIWVKLEY